MVGYLQKKNTFDLLSRYVISGSGTLFICVMDLKEWVEMQTDRLSLQIKVIQNKEKTEKQGD